MRKLANLTFQTLDGVMQAPTSPEEDAHGGFEGGGWVAGYWAEVMEQVKKEAIAETYDMLFGRTTYEMFAAHNMSADAENPMVARMNNARKYVALNTLNDLKWQNSVAIRGDIMAEVSRLKKQAGPLIQIHGSWRLIQSLLEHDLIDEFRIWTFPVLAGSGKRLFESGLEPKDFSLIKSDSKPNGVIMNFYERAG